MLEQIQKIQQNNESELNQKEQNLEAQSKNLTLKLQLINEKEKEVYQREQNVEQQLLNLQQMESSLKIKEIQIKKQEYETQQKIDLFLNQQRELAEKVKDNEILRSSLEKKQLELCTEQTKLEGLINANNQRSKSLDLWEQKLKDYEMQLQLEKETLDEEYFKAENVKKDLKQTIKEFDIFKDQIRQKISFKENQLLEFEKMLQEQQNELAQKFQQLDLKQQTKTIFMNSDKVNQQVIEKLKKLDNKYLSDKLHNTYQREYNMKQKELKLNQMEKKLKAKENVLNKKFLQLQTQNKQLLSQENQIIDRHNQLQQEVGQTLDFIYQKQQELDQHEQYLLLKTQDIQGSEQYTDRLSYISDIKSINISPSNSAAISFHKIQNSSTHVQKRSSMSLSPNKIENRESIEGN